MIRYSINYILFFITGFLRVRFIKPLGRPYIERYKILATKKRHIYMHRYLDPDGDRNLHDHPWQRSFGVVLCGAYYEERMRYLDAGEGPVITVRKIRPWIPNYIGVGCFHKIAAIEPGTWTLFSSGLRVKRWGYFQQEGDRTIYYPNPDSDTHRDWTKNAPRGRHSGREPLGAAISPPQWALRLLGRKAVKVEG